MSDNPDEIEVRRTSAGSADVSPIVLREGPRSRLVFLPTLVDNPNQPIASVRGTFIYQKLGADGSWSNIRGESLNRLKQGEGFRLELHAAELFALMAGVRPLYRLHRSEGLPEARARYVRLTASIAQFLELGKAEIVDFLNTHPQNAALTLVRMLEWAASTRDPAAVLEKLDELSVEQVPYITALLGVSALRGSLALWNANETNADEGFWQTEMTKRAYVFSQAFAYPIVIVQDTPYLGGKQLNNWHGKVADFLFKTQTTESALIIELKTPTAQLLDREYRQDIFPPSRVLAGATAQVLAYRESLMQNFANLLLDGPALIPAEPKCAVVIGNTSELHSPSRKRSFERFRERTTGIAVITFDELFGKVQTLLDILEGTYIRSQ